MLFQSEKNLVRTYYDAIDTADSGDVYGALSSFVAPQYTWRSYHPFGLKTDPHDIADQFWIPFKHAVTSLRRRMDIFFAGRSDSGDTDAVWVCSMGHLMGLFDHAWLGIPPTGKMIMLRYAEFHRVKNNQIAETAFYFDIPHFMMQAGLNPIPNQLGAHMVQPGPAPHDALLYHDAPAEQGAKTLQVINKMIHELGQWQNDLPLEEELALTWHDDMIWWGPAGIGATYTIERYAKQHSGPFRAAFSDRSGTGHIARIAEGHYGGFFGWPNFKAKPTGGYLGLPPSDHECHFNVVDIYRREGDKLKENWVFIDLLSFYHQLGVDILGDLNTT